MRCTDMVMSSASPSLLGLPPRRRQTVCCGSPSPPTHNVVGETLTRIRSSGVIACLRANSAKLAMEAAGSAISGGISVLEIVASTPGCSAACARLSCHALRSWDRFKHRGCREGSKSWCEVCDEPGYGEACHGCITESGSVIHTWCYDSHGDVYGVQILLAYEAGAKIVKVYPVSTLGGVQYISTIKKPFSHIPMVASQGIGIDSIGDYIANGALAVVLSDAIFDKEAMRQNDFKAIQKLASSAGLEGSKAVERLQLSKA